MRALVERRRNSRDNLLILPPSFGVLRYWFRADTFTEANNGEPQQNWINQGVERGIDVGRSVVAEQPTWQASAVNNRPALRFDGTDDNYANPGAPNLAADNWCLWAVMSSRSTGTANKVPIYIGLANTEGYGFAFRINSGSNKGALLGGVAWLNAGEAEEVGFEIWVMQRRSGTIRLWIDGGAPKINTTTAPNNPASSDMYVGYNQFHARADMDLSEWGYYTDSTTLDQVNRIGEYCSQRYALPWSKASDS